MKLAIVLGLALFVWLGEGQSSARVGFLLLACAVVSLLLAQASSDRLRALAPLPPPLFLLDRAIVYAAAPQVLRPEFGAALLGSVALVLHFGLAALVRDSKVGKPAAGLCLSPVDFVYDHEFLRSMQREPDLGIQDDLGLAEDALHEIAEECARRGIVFAMVRLPGSIQCEPSSFLGMLKDVGQDPARFDRREPGASIVADARSRGVPACDLLPVLQVPEGERSPCYLREGHPNRAGNARIAQATLELLEGNDALARALELPEGEQGR